MSTRSSRLTRDTRSTDSSSGSRAAHRGSRAKSSPHLTTRLPALWTNGHSVATVGGATLDVAKCHLED